MVGGRGREKVRLVRTRACSEERAGGPWPERGRCVSIYLCVEPPGRAAGPWGWEVSSLTLLPRNEAWGSSRVSTCSDQKLRLSHRHEEEAAPYECLFALGLLTLGVTFTAPLSHASSIPHPWHHPVHTGVLSITSIKGELRCLTFLLLLSPVPPSPPMDNLPLRCFSAFRVLCNPPHLLKCRCQERLRDLIQQV